MAENAAAAGESMDALAARIDRLNQKLDQAKSAASGAKATGTVMTILTVVAAIIGVLILLSPLKAAYDTPKPYVDALIAEVEASVKPAIQEEMEAHSERILREVTKDASAAFVARQEEMFAAVNTQLETFTTEMQEYGVTEIQDRQERIRTFIGEAVVKEVPELQDEATAELVLANAASAMDSAVKRLMEEYLSEHQNHLLSIEQQISTFPIPAAYTQMSQDMLSQELVNELGIYAMSIFRDTINPETREFIRSSLGEN